MNLPELPAKASRSELRKAMLRLRLEMHREELRNSNAPLWVAAGALLLATFGVRHVNWRRWLRIALIVFPLLRRHPPRAATSETTTP
jgi:hypothetical protein